MVWNISGDVVVGTVDTEELCYQTTKQRILFNNVAVSWEKCMQTCPKYREAQAPTFTDSEGLNDLVQWAFNTTRDPETLVDYSEVTSASFWIPFRYEHHLFLSSFIIF